MKINYPLDEILNSEVKIKILRFLITTKAQWNGRQIAKKLAVSPTTAHKALNALSREGAVLLQNTGKTYVYKSNDGNFIVSTVLAPLFKNEARIISVMTGIIRARISKPDIKKRIISLSFFGSIAEKKDTASSDVDLCVVIREEDDRIRTEEALEQIASAILKAFGNTLSPYINTLTEFKNKRKRKLPVIMNILKTNTLIFGERLECLI